MERLTTRSAGGVWLNRGKEWGDAARYPLQKDARERLADYEDTGLMPEEVAALQASLQKLKKEAVPIMEAKIIDQLILLPCKITDTVYVLESVFKGKKMVGERVVSAQIDRVIIGGATGKPVFDLCSETGNWYKSMEPGDFYLTRGEAEKAKEG